MEPGIAQMTKFHPVQVTNPSQGHNDPGGFFFPQSAGRPRGLRARCLSKGLDLVFARELGSRYLETQGLESMSQVQWNLSFSSFSNLGVVFIYLWLLIGGEKSVSKPLIGFAGELAGEAVSVSAERKGQSRGFLLPSPPKFLALT